MVEKFNNRMSMKSNKKGGRNSVSNRHLKNTKVQNNFSCGGSNSLNWRTETTKNSVNESNNYAYTNHYVTSAFYMLIGLPVEIQKTDGNIYEGILETVSNKVEFHLSHACEKSNSSTQDGTPKNEKMFKTIMFPFSDVVYCRARNVDVDFAKRDTLLTDSAISGTNGAFNGRELVQWQPEEASTETITSGLGEHDVNASWAFDEMIRVNEEEHGVKSTFDSTMSSYMTPLEKGDDEEFRAREKRAEQAAREIQKDPKFKEAEIADSGIGEEELFSAVSRTPQPTSNNSSNSPLNNNTNSSPNNNDGFTTYTSKNYRANRHSKQPINVVGPRLQRNNLRSHEGQNHTSNGNHQVNRNHISSPQRSQNGNSSRNNSYQQHQQMPPHQQHQNQQPPPHAHIENHHKVSMGTHHMQENIPPMHNIRTQGDVSSANSARTTLSYSAVAMKKNPPSANNNNSNNSNNNNTNNRIHSAPKPAMPLQPVVPDIVQPVQQTETFAAVPQAHTPPHTPLIANGHVTPTQKTPQLPPSRTPEALAAAKQQMIQEAKKKASLGHSIQTTSPTSLIPPTATTLSSTQVTSFVAISPPPTSPIHQQPQSVINQQIVNQQTQRQPTLQTNSQPVPPSSTHVEAAEKMTHRLSPISVESLEKSPVNAEAKCETPVAASVSPKEQRTRGEDGKQQQQYLMKYGKIRTPAGADEEKKASSYKNLKEFAEQFKLSDAKAKKRPAGKASDQPVKTPELTSPMKLAELPAKVKSEDKPVIVETTDALPKPVFTKSEDVRLVTSKSIATLASKIEDVRLVTSSECLTTSVHSSPQSSPRHVLTTTATSSSVTLVSCLAQTTATTTASITPSGSEPPSPSMKSALNPSAKEFNLNPSAKEFNPGKEGTQQYSPSPKPVLAKQPSFPGEVQHTVVQQQQYYHGQTVMIQHPSGSEVLSPTVQSVPVKQIYARPYMSAGPGGPAVYSIPTVEFSSNGNNGSPQIIATPQSGFIPAQNMAGQQLIIIHGPNGSVSYQPVVPGGQSQQYYSMQQMIRCVPGHPPGSGVQQTPNRVAANFQQDGTPGGYVLAVSQHAGLVQHQAVPTNQHQGYPHPPQSPVQSSHIQTQYVMSHQVASSYPQNPQNAAQITYTQGNSGATYRSPSSMHSVAGQHHPQQPFVMMTHHQGQHIQTVAMANNQPYVQGQQHGGILQNYQSGN